MPTKTTAQATTLNQSAPGPYRSTKSGSHTPNRTSAAWRNANTAEPSARKTASAMNAALWRARPGIGRAGSRGIMPMSGSILPCRRAAR